MLTNFVLAAIFYVLQIWLDATKKLRALLLTLLAFIFGTGLAFIYALFGMYTTDNAYVVPFCMCDIVNITRFLLFAGIAYSMWTLKKRKTIL